MLIPIIIVHRSNSSYLKYTLGQARYFNPTTPIYLIGDESNNHYPFVTHVNIDDYLKSANRFLENYVHLSFTPKKFEELCFARWFIAHDFVAKHNINSFLCLDSDVLLFCKTEDVHQKFKHYDFTMRGRGGAGFNYFSNATTLIKLCNFMLDHYTKPELFHILKLNWEGYQKMNYGGVCDMLFFALLLDENILKIGDVGALQNNEIYERCLFDINKENEELIYRNRLLYLLKKQNADLVQIRALHVNIEKDKIYRYYTGGGLYKERFKDWFRDMRDKYQLRTRIRKLFTR